MVNQISSSPNTLRSGDSTQPERIAQQQPVAAVSRVSEKKSRQEQQQSGLTGKPRSLLTQTTLAHNQAAQAQTAQKALRDASELLNQLRQVARRSLSSQEGKRDQLQQSLHQLKGKLVKLTREAKYQGAPVLHHDLTPRLEGEQQTEQFGIKGLRLNTLRSQDEIVRFQFESGSPSSVRALIESDENSHEIANKLDRALAPRGIQVGVDKFGDMAFTVDKAEWVNIRKGVWVSGGGQILPSGNPIKARLESHDKQATEPEALEFGKPQQSRQALADIERMLQKVQQALSQIDRAQQQVGADLERIVRTNSLKSGIVNQQGDIEATWMDAPQEVSLQLIENAVPTLLAQANATRHNVVALLEP